MVTEKNNMHDIDTFMFFKWFFKAWVAAVSYTHLDVYKRQFLYGNAGFHKHIAPSCGWLPLLFLIIPVSYTHLDVYKRQGLSHINREKIDAIREAVKELEKAGYIVRSRERDEKGRLRGADYVIYEQPQPKEPEAATSSEQPPTSDLPTLENPTLDNPTLEKPTLEKPTLENPTQLNKDISSKEQSITDLSRCV